MKTPGWAARERCALSTTDRRRGAGQLVLPLSSPALASMILCALVHDFGFVKEHVQVGECRRAIAR